MNIKRLFLLAFVHIERNINTTKLVKCDSYSAFTTQLFPFDVAHMTAREVNNGFRRLQLCLSVPTSSAMLRHSPRADKLRSCR